MIVVADTSPINYLLLIGEIDLLPALFEIVLIPAAVQAELQHDGSSSVVRNWANNPPGWLKIHRQASTPIPALYRLDLGEREAIQLALDLAVDEILIDESNGRREAARLQLAVRGTLGVLERASRLNLVDLRDALNRLQQTTFRMSPALLAGFIERNGLEWP